MYFVPFYPINVSIVIEVTAIPIQPKDIEQCFQWMLFTRLIRSCFPHYHVSTNSVAQLLPIYTQTTHNSMIRSDTH